MKNNELKSQNVFEFDEQGAVEVNQQIMESYNSGFINQEEPYSQTEANQSE
ncbi:hypothetical protein ACF5W4_13945 [Bacillota bacterium Lsc_1132]